MSINDKKTLQTVKNFLNEIEYYEANGKYALADKVQRNLEKLARRVKKDDLGLKALAIDAALGMSFLRLMSDIPACAQIFQSDPNAKASITGDYFECVIGKVNSGMTMDEASQSCANSMLDTRQFPIETDEERELFEKCFEDFDKKAPSLGAQFKQQTAPQQIVPRQLQYVRERPPSL